MKFPRSSGVLLHVTSLPGGHGIGDLGSSAHEFVEFLAEAKQSLWQVLPLGPTGYGDSPYQCFSAFAGNPMLLDMEDLAARGLLDRRDLAGAPENSATTSFQEVQRFKWPLIERAAHNFAGHKDSGYARFCAHHAHWLDDFVLFMAAKDVHGGLPFWHWESDLAERKPEALARWKESLGGRAGMHRFAQWMFFEQFAKLRRACHERNIRLMGDVPIYAAADSADVWSGRNLFLLRDSGEPAWQAGVPPDYYSETGQLWGNPIYDWTEMERRGYAWWIERFRSTFEMFDAVRVDHFRGFYDYWRVPAGETTAVNGEWAPGPRDKLFEAVGRELGDLTILAENLGEITSEVEAFRRRLGFPGMAVLQFAFGRDRQARDFRPHNYPQDIVAYTGTHDNDTTAGWWTSTGGDSTRTAAEIGDERRYALEYLAADGQEIHWSFIRALMASVASTVIFPAQDLLGLGSEARMNMPSTFGRNWKWRLNAGALDSAVASRLSRLVECYERVAPIAASLSD